MSLESVVRVFATIQEPDFDSPWQPRAPSSSTGSGVLVSETRILTGAHVVANATFLQIQKVSNPEKCTASVVAICHDADLALLEVSDPQFFADTAPQEIGELPELRDPVSVVGYPIGGDEISVTEGVVSRIELQRYRQSRRYLLAVTVDAAINSGNSGGPAFKDGKVVGIAFQTLKDAENIGELVPSTLIRSFLRRASQQRLLELPALGARVQNLDNAFLRERLGMRQDQSGCLVQAINFASSAWGILQEGDVITHIDGHSIANNGTVRYLDRLRTGFSVLFGEKALGDSLVVGFLRAGESREETLTLRGLSPLVPQWQYDVRPAYLVCAGLVFQRLSLDFIATWKDWWDAAPPEFLHQLFAGIRSEERQELVVLSSVLADEINVGYERFANEIVESVQGTTPEHLAHFVQLLDEAEGMVDIRTSRGGLIVVDKNKMGAADSRISARYHVSPLCSPELRA